MRGLSLLVLLALGGCGMFGRTTVPVPPGQDEAERACASEANNDPEVKLLIMKGLGSENFQISSQDKLARARQAATIRCLQSRGVLRQGGVERQKPLD